MATLRQRRQHVTAERHDLRGSSRNQPAITTARSVSHAAGSSRRKPTRPELAHRDPAPAPMLDQQERGDEEARQGEEQRHAQVAAAHPRPVAVEADDGQHGEATEAVEAREMAQGTGGRRRVGEAQQLVVGGHGPGSLPRMSTDDDARLDAAAALRDLGHAFVAYERDDDALRALAAFADRGRGTRRDPRRDRLARIQAVRETWDDDLFPFGGRGFEDRAVAGPANPMSVEQELRFEGDEAVVDAVLHRAFEGAPNRAHGGMVVALFDDATGFVIGMLREPTSTGQLTVRFLAAVPVEEPLVIRARRRLTRRAKARHRRRHDRGRDAGGDVQRDLHHRGSVGVRRRAGPPLSARILTSSRGQLEPDDRAAAVAVVRPHGAVVALDDLLHDREPEARAGLGAGRDRPVEAVEHVGQVGVRDPRPAVAHLDPATVDGHLDRAPSLYLIALSTRFEIARSAMCGRTSTGTGAVGDDLDRPTRAPVRPTATASAASSSERDRLRLLLVARPVGGELDELGDEVGELVDLELDALRGRAVRWSGVEPIGAVEELGVGPQARERRAQLVARVGDELLLLPPRGRERVDHRREARGEAADLAAALPRDRRAEVLGRGDALGGVAQSLDRPDESAGEEPAEQRGERRSATEARGARAGSATTRARSRLSSSAAGGLEHPTVVPGHRQHAVALAVDRHGPEPVRRRHRGRVARSSASTGQGHRTVDARGDGAVGGDELRGGRGLERARRGGHPAGGPVVRDRLDRRRPSSVGSRSRRVASSESSTLCSSWRDVVRYAPVAPRAITSAAMTPSPSAIAPAEAHASTVGARTT